MNIPPLNGEKTHPLKPGSIAVLRRLAQGPVGSHLINPGVQNRLRREALAEEFFSNGGRAYRITDAGRAALAKAEGRS
jgi:hypothetical protein